MMEAVKQKLAEIPYAEVEEQGKIISVTVPKEHLYEIASNLRRAWGVEYDFLMDIIGMDYGDRLGVIYVMSATQDPDEVVHLKTSTDDRKNPLLYSVHDLWISAGLYEREVHDYFGIRFINSPDMRRLFLRSDWKGYPLRKDYDADPVINPIPRDNEDLDAMETVPVIEEKNGTLVERTYRLFEPDEYVVNFGPQHPSTHGVLHLRVSLDGEIVKKVDLVLGYIHRGIEKICEVDTYPQILHLTDRLDYLSGAINRHAFCLCCENALQMEVPERAHYIRTIFDELTRISSHLVGWGCMCMDMGAITAFVYAMRDREKIMKIFEETSGGRLMANYSVIGGVGMDITSKFQPMVKEFIPYMRKMLKEHHMLFTGNPIATNRMKGRGRLPLDIAKSFGTTGPSGRASGWHNDIRKIAPYAAYDKIDFHEVTRTGGMVFDRYVIRLLEIEESLHIIEQLIDNIPEGPYAAKTKAVLKLPEGEYMQRVEAARGEFDVYINSKGDKYPYRVKFRSPCMPLVNTLTYTAKGEKVADLIMEGASLDYVIPCIDR